MSNYEVDHDYFDIWSHNMSYIVGFWWADGHIYANNGNFKVVFSIKEEDRYLLELIKQEMKSTHRIYTQQKRGKGYCRLEISSRNLFEQLTYIGGSERKSRIIGLPEVPEKFFSDFVRGLFDGDGSVYRSIKQKYSIITSGSEKLVTQLKVRLEESKDEIGSFIQIIPRSKKKDSWGDIYVLRFSPNNSRRLAKFMYSTPSHLCLYRKKEKLLEFGDQINSGQSKGGNRSKENPLKDLTIKDLTQKFQEFGSVVKVASSYSVTPNAIVYKCRRVGLDYTPLLTSIYNRWKKGVDNA